MDKETRLRLAVQKSGRLTEPCLDLLGRVGLKLSRGKDQLMGFGENLPLDVLFVRDDDIPDLVQEDVCDLGLVGLNVLEERRLEMLQRGASARFVAPHPACLCLDRHNRPVQGVSSSTRRTRFALTHHFMTIA